MNEYKYLIFQFDRTTIIKEGFMFICLCGCNKRYVVYDNNDNNDRIPDFIAILHEHIQQIYNTLCHFDHLEDTFQYLIKERITYNPYCDGMLSRIYRVSLQDWSVLPFDIWTNKFNTTNELLNYFNLMIRENKSLKDQNTELQKENELLKNMIHYHPDGEGAKECEEHYNLFIKN